MLAGTLLGLSILHWGNACELLAQFMVKEERNVGADCLVWFCGLASACVLLTFSVTLLPRKRRRKTKSQIR